MSEQVEDLSFPESKTSGIEAEYGAVFSVTYNIAKFKRSNNKYTRAFLLEFCDATVCGKLPPDFDLLALLELDDASEDKTEGKRTSSKSSLGGSLQSSRWNFDLPGERWDRQSFTLNKGSQSQVICRSDKRGTAFQPLLGQSEYNAGVLVPEGKESDLLQLRKSGNPYRPPHCHKIVDDAKFDTNASVEETYLEKKKGHFLEKSKLVTIEQCETEAVDASVLDNTESFVAQENSTRGSDANQIMGCFSVVDSNNKCSTTPPNNPPHSHLRTNSGGPTNLIEKTPQLQDSCSEHGKEIFMRPFLSTIENDQGDSVHCTTEDDNFDCEFPFSDVEMYINSILGECDAHSINKGGRDYDELGKIEDKECTSDDQWAEISQILQLERVYDHIPNSKIESHLPENLDFNILDDSDDVANSDADINLPDEETLITIDDFIFPPLSTSSINRNLREADSLTSNLAAKIAKNPEALNSSAHSYKVQPCLDVSELVTFGKLHSQLHDNILHSKMSYFHPGNDHVNFFNPFTGPTITRYSPPSLYHTCSDTYPTPCHETALRKPKANDSLIHYSLLEKSYICLQQQNQAMVHPACTDLFKTRST